MLSTNHLITTTFDQSVLNALHVREMRHEGVSQCSVIEGFGNNGDYKWDKRLEESRSGDGRQTYMT